MRRLLHITALLTLLVTGAATTWAQTTVTDELTYTSLGLSTKGTSYSDFSNKTITSSAVYAGNATTNNGSYIQLRSKNSNSGIVTTTSGGTVKSVTIEFNTATTAKREVDVYGSNTAYESASELYSSANRSVVGTKIGSATYATGTTSYTITPDADYAFIGIRSNNGAVYIDKITVEWEEAGPGKTATQVVFAQGNDTIAQNEYAYDRATYDNAATVTDMEGNAISGATVTYTSSDKDHADVDADGKVTIDQTVAGNYTITATFEGNDTLTASSATYNIVVLHTVTTTGTEDDPYSVEDALAIVNTGKQTTDSVYVKGTVVSKGTFNSRYPNINIFIADDTTSTAPTMEGFRTRNVGNTDITAASDVAVGDIVLLKGVLTKYQSTVELDKGNYIVKFYERELNITEDQWSGMASLKEGGHNVTVSFGRSYNTNVWNSMVLPFSVDKATAETNFKTYSVTSLKLAVYTGTTANADGSYTLLFNTQFDSIRANQPFFIYVEGDLSYPEYTDYLTGITVFKDDTPTLTPDGAAFSFVGTYTETTAATDDWFVSADNNFYKATGTETIKPMRAVFRPTTEAAAAKGLYASFDGGTPTRISSISGEGFATEGNAQRYNLQGQRVGASYKGVVIENGKKYVSR